MSQPPFPPGPQPGPALAGPAPAPPPRKSKTGLIVVIGVLVVAVTVGSSVFLALHDGGKDAGAPTIRVVAPDTLNNRAKSTDPDLVASSQQTVEDIKSDLPSATGVVSASYGSGDEKDLTLLVAVADVNRDPRTALDATLTGVNKSTPLSGLHDVDAGPLGGVAQCGDTNTSGIQVGACFWADRGSLGYFYSYFASAADAERELVSVRQAVEQI